MKIYLSLPITGRKPEEILRVIKFWKESLEEMGYEVFSPFFDAGLRTDEPIYSHGYTGVITDQAIFRRDRWYVENCDIFLMDMSGFERASVGCIMELAWANLLNKHTIMLRDQYSVVYNHTFIKQASDVTFYFGAEQELLNYLRNLVKKGM